MAKKPKNKMPLSSRAKQFIPFSALAGLDEALREEELKRELVQTHQLSEKYIDDSDCGDTSGFSKSFPVE